MKTISVKVSQMTESALQWAYEEYCLTVNYWLHSSKKRRLLELYVGEYADIPEELIGGNDE